MPEPMATPQRPNCSEAAILPISDDPNDDGAQMIDQAQAAHHVTDMLENGEDG